MTTSHGILSPTASAALRELALHRALTVGQLTQLISPSHNPDVVRRGLRTLREYGYARQLYMGTRTRYRQAPAWVLTTTGCSSARRLPELRGRVVREVEPSTPLAHLIGVNATCIGFSVHSDYPASWEHEVRRPTTLGPPIIADALVYADMADGRTYQAYVEYDTGTKTTRDVLRQLAAYALWHESGTWGEYHTPTSLPRTPGAWDGFPPVLLVTSTPERADNLLRAIEGPTAPPALRATAAHPLWLLATDLPALAAHGPHKPIWREPYDSQLTTATGHTESPFIRDPTQSHDPITSPTNGAQP